MVVGDIHGAYDLVLEALHQCNFNPAVDRLFAVGDLIDRGEGSHRCAKFLAQPYVHAVRGNHEDMLIDLFAEGEPHPSVVEFMALRNGFGWWLSASDEDRRDILDAIRKLPLAIEIETARGTVGLIHADVPRGLSWQEFLFLLDNGDDKTIETCLWGRSRISRNEQDGVAGVGRMFVGHTPQWEGVNRYGNVYAIDTGAVYGQQGHHEGGHLTMAGITAQTSLLLTDRCMSSCLVNLLDDQAETLTPFGQYATGLQNQQQR